MKRVLDEKFKDRQRIGARVTFNHLETEVVSSAPETLFFTSVQEALPMKHRRFCYPQGLTQALSKFG
jgi:hypothetical protein